MTNWKTHKIVDKIDAPEFNEVIFQLYGSVPYKDKIGWIAGINCVHRSPFNTWKVGDLLDIDIDKTRNYEFSHQFNDLEIVRKYGSSAAVTSSSGQMSLSREQAEAFADRLADRVERSGGQYELDAYIQQGTEPHGTPYTRQGWIYRKK